MSCSMEYPFVQWGSAVPAMSPSRSLSTPILLTGGAVQEAKKRLDSMQFLLSSNKMFWYYLAFSQHKSKTQPSASHREENLI